jgi:hypothetical protein
MAMALRRFIIERDIPAVGTLDRQQLAEAAGKSNACCASSARHPVAGEYVADGKTFCVYSPATRRSSTVTPS